MHIIAQTFTSPQQEKTEAEPDGCQLGRKLGDCRLKRAGCGSLFEVLTYCYPPLQIIAELRSRSDLDPKVRGWLARIQAITTPTYRRWGR